MADRVGRQWGSRDDIFVNLAGTASVRRRSMNAFFDALGFEHFSENTMHYGLRLAAALLVLLVGFWLSARVANFGRRAMQRAKVDPTLIGFLRNVI
jgi:hypothetical protein